MPEEQIKVGLAREQKIGFVLLFIFALLAVVLGLVQLRNTITRPFALSNAVPSDIAENVDSNRALHYRDTDRDGLTDFDELYVYSTSPYLADTDSDGTPDKQEVARGTNPLCDENKGDCTGLISNPDFATVTTTESDPVVVGFTEPTPPSNLDLSAMLKDPAQVRQMLLSAGVSIQILNKISDADLMKMVVETMSTSSLTAASPGQALDINSINKLNSLATSTK